MSEKKYYVYVHRYASGPKEGQVFYVGKGSGRTFKRANSFSPSARSKEWFEEYEKYGVIVDVVAEFSMEVCSFSIERALIASYGKENLVNKTSGGQGTSGSTVSEQNRKIASDRLKGIPPSRKAIDAAINKNSKRVLTKCGKSFRSISDAARYFFPDRVHQAKSGISACLKGKVSSYCGIEFSLDVGGVFSDTYINRRPKTKVYCSNGMEFNSMPEVVEFLNKEGHSPVTSNIYQCCLGRVNSAYGYKWSYSEDVGKYVKPSEITAKKNARAVIRSDGIMFKSASEAARYMDNFTELKARQSAISAVCTGSRKVAYGYGWRYADDKN